MKKVYLIGTSGGTREGLSPSALDIIESSGLVIGAERLLANIHPKKAGTRALTSSTEILAAIRETGEEEISVLFSGDTGFFSGAKRLILLLNDSHIDCEVIPGLSSLSMAAAAFGLSYSDMEAVSLHGRARDSFSQQKIVSSAVMTGKPCFFLTDSYSTPQSICEELCAEGLADTAVRIAENLGTPDEKLQVMTAEEAANSEFGPLCVLLTEAAPVTKITAAGLPDDAFIRAEGVPMTKRYVRSAIFSALEMQPGDIVWDIGAGTGSVSIEAALLNRTGIVYSVECREEAQNLLWKNRSKFSAYNMEIIGNEAPGVLPGLPAPDRVFIGGSNGNLPFIVCAVLEKNPSARIVISAVTIETMVDAQEIFLEKDIPFETVTINVSDSREVGAYHMLRGQNPVMLFIAGGKG